ncbi:MAG: RluA family pseudouridine synthase [Alphaproteobacteria bacterium]|nr:RluA family pseudouridine synthase [Alphaproteobacteria bacterium]MCB9931399.1 RluA family pseudouridine synthase [Alphaproteobacteria bacterium]
MRDDDELRHATIPPALAGERLDRAAAALWPDLSRTRLRVLIESGDLRTDRALSPSATVREGEALSLRLPPPVASRLEPQAIPLAILYEDEAVLVIDKPPGLVVHPAPGHPDGTLVNAVLAHCGDSLAGVGGERRPGIVHRLDKDTSGVMVVAKSQAAHANLVAQFQVHSIERAYIAFVSGTPNPPQALIDLPIGRHPGDRKRMSVVARGRPARTHYTVERYFGQVAAQVRCRLETGRTHQIRVHLSHSGLPVLGDPVYLNMSSARRAALKPVEATLKSLGRQALHAAVLGFAHPLSGETVRFESDLPSDLRSLQKCLIQSYA